MFVDVFNVGLLRLVGRIKISLLLKMHWKEHHSLYVKDCVTIQIGFA